MPFSNRGGHWSFQANPILPYRFQTFPCQKTLGSRVNFSSYIVLFPFYWDISCLEYLSITAAIIGTALDLIQPSTSISMNIQIYITCNKHSKQEEKEYGKQNADQWSLSIATKRKLSEHTTDCTAMTKWEK